MFFGRHSEILGDVLRIYYYELFPNELKGISESMQRMMVSGSMKERDSVTIQAMVEEGFIAPEKVDITLDLIISVHQNFIYEVCTHGEHLDLEAHKKRFTEMFEYILAAAK